MITSRVKYLLLPALLGIGFSLSACSFERDPEVLQNPAYKSGHADGCQTAHTRVSGFKDTVHRNEALYESDSAYRAGWGDGFAACGGQSNFDDRSIFNEQRDNSSIRY